MKVERKNIGKKVQEWDVKIKQDNTAIQVSSTLTSILTSLKRSSSLSYMLAWTSPLDSLDRFLPSPGRPAGITASECQGSKIRNTRLTCIKKYWHLSLSLYIYTAIYMIVIYILLSLRQ